MDYTGIIYLRTCRATSKVYVGQTINEKARQACWYDVDSTYSSPNSKIEIARTKYGVLDWDYSVLYKIISNDKTKVKHALDNREKYFIKYYNSFNDGYNSTRGGGSITSREHFYNFTVTLYDCLDESTIELPSLEKAADILSTSFGNILRILRKNELNELKPLVRDRYLLCKTSLFKSGYLNNSIQYYKTDLKFRKVARYSTITGDLVNTYKNYIQASEELNIPKKYITNYLRDKTSFVGKGDGFGFMFLDEYESLENKSELILKPKIFPVVQLDCYTGELLNRFSNVNQAMEYVVSKGYTTNTNSSSINCCCHTYCITELIKSDDWYDMKMNRAYNYVWMYEVDYNKLIEDGVNIQFHIISKYNETTRIIKYDLDWNIEDNYFSKDQLIKRFPNLSKSALNNVLVGNSYTYLDHRWVYYRDLPITEKQRVDNWFCGKSKNPISNSDAEYLDKRPDNIKLRNTILELDILLNVVNKHYDSGAAIRSLIKRGIIEEKDKLSKINSLYISAKSFKSGKITPGPGNLYWVREEDYLNRSYSIEELVHMPVIQFDGGLPIKVYLSASIATKENNYKSGISKICRTNQRYDNYIWKYYKDLTPDEKEKVNEFLKTQNNNGE